MFADASFTQRASEIEVALRQAGGRDRAADLLETFES
jgi:hypothetical protein